MYSILAVPFVTTYIGVFFWDFTPFLNFLENFLKIYLSKLAPILHIGGGANYFVSNIIWHKLPFLLRCVYVNYTYRTYISLSDIVPDVSSYFPCVNNFIFLPDSFCSIGNSLFDFWISCAYTIAKDTGICLWQISYYFFVFSVMDFFWT